MVLWRRRAAAKVVNETASCQICIWQMIRARVVQDIYILAATNTSSTDKIKHLSRNPKQLLDMSTKITIYVTLRSYIALHKVTNV